MLNISVAEAHEPPLRRLFTGWQKGFHDERIETQDQFENTLRYVRFNAWHHSLTTDPEEWPWSSLKFMHLVDVPNFE